VFFTRGDRAALQRITQKQDQIMSKLDDLSNA